MPAVFGSYSAPTINWGQFISDMKEKWRYRWGSPEVKDALTMAQADYYKALATMGIPSEAYLRQMTADVGIPSEAEQRRALTQRYLSEIEQSKINPELVSQFIGLLAPLLVGKDTITGMPTETTPSTTALPSQLPTPNYRLPMLSPEDNDYVRTFLPLLYGNR